MKKESIFKNRNFTLVFLGALVSNIGALLYSFAVSFYILSITENNSVIQGAYLAAVGIALIVATPLGGVLADRFNKGKIMYICDYLKGALILLSTILIFVYKDDYVMKIVLLFVVGVFASVIAGLFSPASGAILPEIISEDRYQEGNTLFSILNSFQGIVGVMLAGILYSYVSIYTLFIVVGVCYILSGISEMFIRYDMKKSSTKLTIKDTLSDLKSGFKYMASDKAILTMIICIIFINFFSSPIFENILPYIAETDLANSNYLLKEYVSPEMFSSIFTIVCTLGSLIGGIIFNRRELKNRMKVNKIALLICGLTVVSLAASYIVFVNLFDNINGFIISLFVILFVVGFVLVFVNIPINVTLMEIV